ncbi:MAG: hypothetical protein ACRCS0_04000 [Albidovulum sp.]
MFGSADRHYFDRSFLLTGAASGLGPALARALVARGVKVLAIDDRRPQLDGIAASLAADLSDPLAALATARWIAAEHRDFGGMICNLTPARQGGAVPASRIIAPLSVMGLLDRLLPARAGSVVALVLPSRPIGHDLVRLATALQDANWNGGGCLRLTTALLEATPGDFSDAERGAAADAVLDALARNRRVLRLRPRRSRWRKQAPLAAGRAGEPQAG